MKVLKFGGTSMGSAQTFEQVKNIVLKEKKGVCVIVSAMGGVTNLLIKAGTLSKNKDLQYAEVFQSIKSLHIETAQNLLPIEKRSAALSELMVHLNKLEDILYGIYLTEDLSDKVMALLSSYGEVLSSFLFYQYLFLTQDFPTVAIHAKEFIKVEKAYLGAKLVKELTYLNLKNAIDSKSINVIPGFICSNEKNEICTLGRGGSDYTAAIIAGAIHAEILEIWTDVSGMFTTNPKMVKQAFPIENISYQEAMELSHFGAKVLYPPTIQPVLEKEIPIVIKNTFDPAAKGTLISQIHTKKHIVSGISHIENISLLTLEGSGMVGVPGFSKRLFGALASVQINIILITQASSEHSICIGILSEDVLKAQQVVNEEFAFEISLQKMNPILVENNLAIVALVGENMKNHQGTSGKLFNVLGKNNVNIRAIAQGASERNISTVIHEKHISKALNVIHEAFFETHKLTLNLFVLGLGNVGEKLIEQIKMQTSFLKNERKINLNVVALANSSKLLLHASGLDLTNWKQDFTQAQSYELDSFIESIKELNLPNTLVIDNTASEKVSDSYASFLKESIPIVTCNKIACSSNFKTYTKLKTLSRDFNAAFLYETTVGAGLPIINTLQNLISSGDKVIEMKAVLSGSLNFIFNNYQAEASFASIVKQAGMEGYTEPDPRIDLSGLDVMRKILILARETGKEMEIDDVKSFSFLPKTAQNTSSIEEFLAILEKEENYFKEMYVKAKSKQAKLKFVASYHVNNGAHVALEEVDASHPFYNIQGKDNIVLFYTERYVDQPLIIQGAGAGAAVTASGIFADIMKLSNA